MDLRVPYIGYSAESESYTAAGISAYHALQAHVEKRLSRGLQLGFSYTYSHSTDEQSAMGLFYNGNNPQIFIRDMAIRISTDTRCQLHLCVPVPEVFLGFVVRGKLADGWSVSGVTVLQSGQPYSVIDYSGAVGSIFYGVNDGITNPIVPLAPGCTPQNALTGSNGVDSPLLKADCFTIPIIAAGGLGGAIASNDPYETNFISSGQRNIFRQPWQRRGDISIGKTRKITEHVSARYTFDIFNVTDAPATTSRSTTWTRTSSLTDSRTSDSRGQPRRVTTRLRRCMSARG